MRRNRRWLLPALTTYCGLPGVPKAGARDSKMQGPVSRPVLRALVSLAVLIITWPSTAEAQDTPVFRGFLLSPSGGFTPFDVPGSQDTGLAALNNAGQAAGIFSPAGTFGDNYGFLRDASGTISTFTIPNQILNSFDIVGLNASGTIGGNYTDAGTRTDHGFLRDVSGNITTITVPGSLNTFLVGVNNLGQLAGNYYDGTTSGGFVRDVAGNFTLINLGGSNSVTLVQAFNNLGATAGLYGTNVDGHGEGFIRDASGGVTSFNITGGQLLSINGLNDSGVVLGTYFSATTLITHEFLRSVSGVITSFDVPGTIINLELNNLGVVAGTYDNGSGIQYGFIRDASGNITTYSFPPGLYTAFGALNDLGEVGGTYISAVPEPSSLVLMGIAGAIGLVVRRVRSGRLA